MTVTEFLKETSMNKINSPIRPVVICADGISLSIQASLMHHCSPKADLVNGEYDTLEVLVDVKGRDWDRFEKHSCSWEDFDARKTLFNHVSMRFLELFIKEHGGIETINYINGGH